MKNYLLLVLLLSCVLPYSQDTEPRSLKVGVHVGRSQARISEAYTVSENTGASVSLFHTMLNQFGVSASLGSASFPKLHYKLGLGYQSLETAHGEAQNQFIEGYSMPIFYVKPGIGFNLPIDDRWKIIPSISAAFNSNLDQFLAFKEWNVRYETEKHFITLNPAIEIQMNADGAWYLSAYAEYQLGFAPVVTNYYPNPNGESDSKMGVYNGSAMNLGLKLQYCLPCKG